MSIASPSGPLLPVIASSVNHPLPPPFNWNEWIAYTTFSLAKFESIGVTSFTDESVYPRTIGNGGGVATAASSSPYSGGISLHFNGSSQYLNSEVLPATEGILGEKFTYAAYVKPEAFTLSGPLPSRYRTIWSYGVGATDLKVYFDTDGFVNVDVGGSTVVLTSTTQCVLNTFYWIALVKTPTTMTLYVNWIAEDTKADTTIYGRLDDGASDFMEFGRWESARGHFQGEMQGITVLNTYIDPTLNVDNLYTQFGTVNALLPYTATYAGFAVEELGATGGQTITDATGDEWDLNDDINIIDTNVLVGPTSIERPISTTGHAKIQNFIDHDFKDEDFTVEFNLYKTASVNNGFIYASTGVVGSSIPSRGVLIYFDGTDHLLIDIRGTPDVFLRPSTPTPKDEWVHIAVTREGNTFTVWQNGVSLDTETASLTVRYAAGHVPVIAAANDSEVHDGLSYGHIIDAFRVTRRLAKYTAPFTPPTVEEPILLKKDSVDYTE